MKNLRAASLQDFLQLRNWFESTHELVSWGGPMIPVPLDETACRALFAETHAAPRQRAAWTLEAENQVVGHAQLGLSELPEAVWLGRVAIHPNQRMRGYGAELVSKVVDLAHSEFGAGAVRLRVFDFRKPARTLYAKLGFVEVGCEEQQIPSMEESWTAIIMELRR